jgi:hypothetical protein
MLPFFLPLGFSGTEFTITEDDNDDDDDDECGAIDGMLGREI